MSELRDNLRRLIVLHITSSGYTVDELTDAAIALIRNETLEEAARVVALMPRTYDKIKQDHDVLGMKGTWTFTLNNGPAECAAAIRALKDRT